MICLTFDQDWAPRWASERILDTLTSAGLRGTFFVTHECPCLATIRARGAMELAWHPNYRPGSDHGASVADVLATMRRLVPEGVGVRAHWLAQGTSLWVEYSRLGLIYDSSDLLDGEPGLHPLPLWNGLVRLPIFCADDVLLLRGRALALQTLRLDLSGLKVFCFHPLLVALNSSTLSGYRAMKAAAAAKGQRLCDLSEEDVLGFRSPGWGMGDLFSSLVEKLEHDGLGRTTLREIAMEAAR